MSYEQDTVVRALVARIQQLEKELEMSEGAIKHVLVPLIDEKVQDPEIERIKAEEDASSAATLRLFNETAIMIVNPLKERIADLEVMNRQLEERLAEEKAKSEELQRGLVNAINENTHLRALVREPPEDGIPAKVS